MAGGRGSAAAAAAGRLRLSSAVGLPVAAAACSAVDSRGRRGRRTPSCRSSQTLAAAGRIATAVSAPAALSSRRSPPTCCFSSAAAAGDGGGSATPTDGGGSSSSSDGDNDSGGDGGGVGGKTAEEWPAPDPSQAYVARARCGQRYEHPEGGTKIRAVVSDLDGTLLGPDKQVSATTLEAVRKARCEVEVEVGVGGAREKRKKEREKAAT